jgi:hypothetical protein
MPEFLLLFPFTEPNWNPRFIILARMGFPIASESRARQQPLHPLLDQGFYSRAAASGPRRRSIVEKHERAEF